MDIGVHQDGLVHISQLADRFIKEPQEVVKVHQQVMVTVLDVDLPRNRISLSMKENPEQGGPRARQVCPTDRPEKTSRSPAEKETGTPTVQQSLCQGFHQKVTGN